MRPATSTGNDGAVNAPVPSSPERFEPQHNTRPLLRRPHVCQRDPESSTTSGFVNVIGAGGFGEFATVTRPSFWLRFDPQHHTSPVISAAQV